MELGSNLRMSEVSAAIGLEQLKQLDRWVERRRSIAERYTKAIEENTFLQAPKVRPGAEHAWHQFCVHTEHPKRLVHHFDRLEIDARRYYTTPIHRQAVFATHPQHSSELENTNKLGATLVAIPVMHELTEAEIVRIVQALKEFNVA